MARSGCQWRVADKNRPLLTPIVDTLFDTIFAGASAVVHAGVAGPLTGPRALQMQMPLRLASAARGG
jgi:hypothetical protein